MLMTNRLRLRTIHGPRARHPRGPGSSEARRCPMRIAVKGRNTAVSEELREHVERRFHRIARQVSPLAELELELREERNRAIPDSQVAEATLHLKGVTLRARDASPDMLHSVNLCADELARQVKRHRDKRRKRREARTPQAHVTGPQLGAEPASGGDVSPAP